MDNAILEIVLRARDEASATINNLRKSLDNVKPGADLLTGAMLAAGAAVTGVSIVSTKLASDFQSSMTLIQTQAGASAEEVKKMSSAVLELATKTGTAPKTLADGLFYIESAGYQGAKALDILTLAAEGAKVGQADLAETANILTTVMTSGIKGVTGATDAMGVLNATVGAGKMKMGDLVGAMSTGILPSAQAAGISMQQLGATLATLTNNGIPAVDAATRLRMSISLMAAPSSKAVDSFKSIGMGSTQLAEDMQSGGIIKALADLQDHMKNLSAVGKEQLFGNAFGVREGATMMTLVGNVDQLKSRLAQINQTSSNFGDAWKKTSGDADIAFAKLTETVRVLAIDYGNKLLPAVTNVTNYLASNLIPAVKESSTWIEKNKTALGIIAGVITAVVMPALIAYEAQVGIKNAAAVAKFIIEEWKMIAMLVAKTVQLGIATASFLIHTTATVASTIATGAMTAATWALNAAMVVLTSPITLIVLAIAAVIAIGYLLITHWAQVKSVGKMVFDSVGGFFTDLGKTVSAIVDGVKQDIKDMVNYVIDGVNTMIRGVNGVSAKVPGLGSNIQIPEIKQFQDGGWVPQTGLAVVHQGEFVLSRSMLRGQQGVPQQISNTTNNTTRAPINIYATINETLDMNILGNKIAFAIRNSR